METGHKARVDVGEKGREGVYTILGKGKGEIASGRKRGGKTRRG